MSQYYPIFVDLENKPPDLIPDLEELVKSGCEWENREYQSDDIQDAILVFSCTEKEEINALVAKDAKVTERLINVVDDPEKCSFIVPSIIEQGDLCITVSTAGSGVIKRNVQPDKRLQYWDRVTDGEVRELIRENKLQEAKEVMELCFRSLLG